MPYFEIATELKSYNTEQKLTIIDSFSTIASFFTVHYILYTIHTIILCFIFFSNGRRSRKTMARCSTRCYAPFR